MSLVASLTAPAIGFCLCLGEPDDISCLLRANRQCIGSHSSYVPVPAKTSSESPRACALAWNVVRSLWRGPRQQSVRGWTQCSVQTRRRCNVLVYCIPVCRQLDCCISEEGVLPARRASCGRHGRWLVMYEPTGAMLHCADLHRSTPSCPVHSSVPSNSSRMPSHRLSVVRREHVN